MASILSLCVMSEYVNSLKQSDAFICQRPSPSFTQLMAWTLFGAKPLSKAMLFTVN